MELATKQDFDALTAQIKDLSIAIERMSESLSLPDVLYTSDLALIENLSISGIKKNPWLLPDFGVSEYPTGPCRWTTKKVREWREIPVKDRFSMWQQRTRNRLKACREA